jgi:hypothetical protein
MSVPSEARLREVFGLVERHIEEHWGVPVVIRDVPSPFTGNLDGATIDVDYDLTVEDALFVVIHLFGHTVQWNVSAEARRIALLQPVSWSEGELAHVAQYEQEAARYSLQLLHDLGIRDVDQWISDFAGCDVRYLLHFYRTGEKREFRGFWFPGEALLAPLPIPPFRPERWISRWPGVVI